MEKAQASRIDMPQCPQCGRSSWARRKRPDDCGAAPGDVVICGNCGVIFVWDPRLCLRAPEQGELSKGMVSLSERIKERRACKMRYARERIASRRLAMKEKGDSSDQGDPVCEGGYSDEELDAMEAEAKADSEAYDAAGLPAEQFDGVLDREILPVAIDNGEELTDLALGEDEDYAAKAADALIEKTITNLNAIHEISCEKPLSEAGKACDEFKAMLIRELVSHAPVKVTIKHREHILSKRHPHFLSEIHEVFGEQNLRINGGGPTRLMYKARKYFRCVHATAVCARECREVRLFEEQQRVLKHEKFFLDQELSESEEDNLFMDVFVPWIDKLAEEELEKDYPDIVSEIRNKDETLRSRFLHSCKRSLFVTLKYYEAS